MSWFVRESECAAYKQILREENQRQNHRILELEKALHTMQEMARELQKLSINMESFCNEQKAQGERLLRLEEQSANIRHIIEEQKEHAVRIKRLEDAAEDKTWAHIKRRALETAVTVASTAMVIGLIMIMANNI